MLNSIGHILLFGAVVTAWLSGRAHRPIALVLSWVCIGDYLVTQPIPGLMVYMATATNSVAIVAAAWAAGQSRARPYFALIFSVGAVIATVGAMVADRFGVAGQCMAYFWVLCAMVGGAGLYGSDAPPLTRTVLIFLVGGLPCEALGWFSWGAGFDAGYAFARVINNLSLLMILGIQVVDGEAWRPRWATLPGRHLPRIREWARTWRRAELDDEPTKSEPRG